MTTSEAPAPDEGVGALLDQAEVYLSLAGEPQTPTEYLLHAQTAAMIGLLKVLGVKHNVVEPEKPVGRVIDMTKVPSQIFDIAANTGLTVSELADAMQTTVRIVPDWDVKKIHAIKELRGAAKIGLKEAKDVIDTTVYHPDWWK